MGKQVQYRKAPHFLTTIMHNEISSSAHAASFLNRRVSRDGFGWALELVASGYSLESTGFLASAHNGKVHMTMYQGLPVN